MSGYKTEQEAIDAARAEAQEEILIPFEGWNCDDFNDEANCGGWDGFSRRCECGNRRVDWVTERNVDGTFYAYAEAY